MDPLHETTRRSFGSDNYAGVHPEVLQALADANLGHQVAYGADVYTTRLTEVMSRHFRSQVQVYPVFTGTGANVLALQAMLPRWGAVICAESAHINTDENGAPERVGGIKLLPVDATDGRLTTELVESRAGGRGDEHRAQPGVVSITQSTELGTCYTPDQIARLAEQAHALGMTVHMDGARIANAAARLDLPLHAMTTDVGVDVVSLGGTKNGALAAEAVIVLNPDAVHGTVFLRKIAMQLASKMRFLSAQLLALYDGDLWLRSARHANAMADRLSVGLRRLGVAVPIPTEANAVFAVLADPDPVRAQFGFYDWGEGGLVRLMCAFDTTAQDVDALCAAVAARSEQARVDEGQR